MSLSSLIVQREIATIRQVEEALARQVLYGGDLVTNLLEVASDLSEAQLTAVLSVSFDKEPATAGPLPTPSPQALAMIPLELASRRSVFPIEADAQRLLLAVAEPLPREEEEGLAFALGLRIDCWNEQPETAGSYLVLRPGELTTHRDALAQPTGRVIHAGAETSSSRPAQRWSPECAPCR